MTITELMIVIAVVLVLSLATASMYAASMESWIHAGSELALQRNGDFAFERIAQDIMSGSKVKVGGDGTSLAIYRIATSIGDSLVASYTLSGNQILNQHDDVVLEDVESLTFQSPDGWRVRMAVRLRDDRGTDDDEYDDSTMYLESVAIVRNLPSPN
jgi:hypothetical protein